MKVIDHTGPAAPILNLADVQIRTLDPEEQPKGTPPANYDVRWGEIAGCIGARQLGYSLTVVAPGKRNCPFHSHHVNEEMFLILEGSGELRYGDQRYPLKRGDIIACPPGGLETAHQIINTGTAEMRYLAVSTMAPADVCQYPDSGKFGAFAGAMSEATDTPRFRYIGNPGDAHDYWEGE